MSLQRLKYFLQLCEDRNISKASDNLYISQQGLSKALQRLEKDFDTPLFERTTTGLEITECGIYVKEYALLVIKEVNILREKIDKAKSRKEDKLKVGSAFGIFNALTTELIEDFRKINPYLNFSFIEYTDFACEQSVLDGSVDLGLTIGPVDQRKFDAKIVKCHQAHALVNKDNPLYSKATISIKDLKNEKIILVNEEFKMYHNFVSLCHQAGFEPDILLTTAEILIPYKMSRLNKGIGITVDFVSQDISYENVKSIPFEADEFTWDITIITAKGKPRPNICEEFIRYIQSIAQKE